MPTRNKLVVNCTINLQVRLWFLVEPNCLCDVSFIRLTFPGSTPLAVRFSPRSLTFDVIWCLCIIQLMSPVLLYKNNYVKEFRSTSFAECFKSFLKTHVTIRHLSWSHMKVLTRSSSEVSAYVTFKRIPLMWLLGTALRHFPCVDANKQVCVKRLI